MNKFNNVLKCFKLNNGTTVHYYSLPELEKTEIGSIAHLPFSVKILLESLIRYQGHPAYNEEHVKRLANWNPSKEENEEFPFQPARVLLQDFTGVPCIADLAALRTAMKEAGKDPAKIEPQIQVDLVIDHSVQVDSYEGAASFQTNVQKEFERNSERYVFLRWGQNAFHKLRIVPPGLGICHQVNLEYLGKCVMTDTDTEGRTVAFPDTLVGTDSHTTMINGLGILGWGVGGIEAEAAMLGQPIPLLTPLVTGVRVIGEMQPGVTATDFALTVTNILRAKNVVGHFVEFFGPGLDHLSLADRATVANMAPEYGATMGFFPIDQESLRYLKETGRTDEEIELVEKYCKAQDLFRTKDSPEPVCNQILELDLSKLESSVAGPKRPQDRLNVRDVKSSFNKSLTASIKDRGFGLTAEQLNKEAKVDSIGTLKHGSVVVAAITSCTNTSNPHVLLAAGLVAKKAVERGLKISPTIKTSLAPGSRVVTEYLKRSGLLPYLEQLNFYVVAYGCTTCIGNSGPLDARVEAAIGKEKDLVVSAVLSGNRNFEGRVHPLTKANYLCSPPLVVAYALAGTMNIDLTKDPIGNGKDGKPVYLKDLWPSENEIRENLKLAADPATYRKLYKDIASSNPAWNELDSKANPVYTWDTKSTYIQEPPFVKNIQPIPAPLRDIEKANVLGNFGDFITTDHISPAGSISKNSPAATYLISQGVTQEDFNSYGARRGNHEVMMRGTFANIRIRNKMVEKEGGWTVYIPTGETVFIYDAAMKYQAQGTPLIVMAGKMYGAGSSRDWAAKGTQLLGVQAVIAESFERIHRSNLVEMGVLPLEFVEGQNADTLGLTGRETYTIRGIKTMTPGQLLEVVAELGSEKKKFTVKSRVDSPLEIEYYKHGGILPYVLRESMKA